MGESTGQFVHQMFRGQLGLVAKLKVQQQ